MVLLAILVCTPALGATVIGIRCAIWFIPECLNRPWVPLFRDWLGETIPVLVALIVANRPPRQ
jgi:hypothetical protein